MTTSKLFYSHLSELRELFHKFGKLDDSNAKLDEISKYISIYVHQLRVNTKGKLHLKNLITQYEKDKSFKLASILNTIFKDIANAQEFLSFDGISIFGSSPTLNIDDRDNQFAYLLLKLVVEIVEAVRDKKTSEYNFDLLNESFGHFVRDNFRNNVEDAQYMTPAEAVEFMCNIALFDLKRDNIQTKGDFIVCDPCCGVGSFLSTFYQMNKEHKVIKADSLVLLGQDKVARMARLAKINMNLHNNNKHIITSGNSLSGASVLDKYHGKIDLILTNPPFGAKFLRDDIAQDSKIKYPLLNDLFDKSSSNFNSEVLFIDRCISLLKPGGKLLAVIPDSVISSGSYNSILRQRIISNDNITVKGIVELPAVTFAQAGTRTKTCILYLEKAKHDSSSPVFISQCEDIGFEVSMKKGASVKISSGKNDLVAIFDSYKKNEVKKLKDEVKILNVSPSSILIKSNILESQSWTPTHYSAKKYEVIKNMRANVKNIELVKLSDLVEFTTIKRRKEQISGGSKCISVLHIVNNDNLNLEEMLCYSPKYAGIKCKPGDLLFSKINPRILRLFVIPEIEYSLSCSSEFEIMNSKTEITNYGIKLLLMLPSVRLQINHLTSGTSSSHNRIKTKELSEVMLPIPRKGSLEYNNLMEKASRYEKDFKKANQLKFAMHDLKQEIFELVS